MTKCNLQGTSTRCRKARAGAVSRIKLWVQVIYRTNSFKTGFNYPVMWRSNPLKNNSRLLPNTVHRTWYQFAILDRLHIIFEHTLNLSSADDVTEEIPSEDGSVRIAGLQAFLPKEHCGRIIMLPILEHGSTTVGVIFELVHTTL